MTTRVFFLCVINVLCLQLRFHVHVKNGFVKGYKVRKHFLTLYKSAEEFGEILLWGLVKGLFYFLEFLLP